jgi:hypothetical protein
MSSIKKFIESSDADLVEKDDVLNPGDWVLKWDPKAPDDQTGFALFTPKSFNPEAGNGPLGGLALAAMFFLMEHGDGNFAQELVTRANELADVKKKSAATRELDPVPTKKVFH